MNWRLAKTMLSLLVTATGACGGKGDSLAAPNCDAIAAVLVSRVEVQPTAATLNLGDSLQLQAVPSSCSGPVAGAGPVRWRAGDSAVAVVSDAGMVIARRTGSVQIFASTQAIEGAAAITVRLPPVVHVTVTPATVSLLVGRTSTLVARAFDAQDREVSGRGVVWSSENTSVVTVDGMGVVTGRAIGGPVAVTATVEGKSASAQVRVARKPVFSVAFVQQPGSATLGSPLSDVSVQLLDQDGARVSDATTAVTLSLGSNPGGATLSGTLTQSAVNGLSIFSGLLLDRAGDGYTLAATASSLGSAASSAFSIIAVTPPPPTPPIPPTPPTPPAVPTSLAFLVQPCQASCMPGQVISPAPQVAIRDGSGNLVTTSTATVDLELAGRGGNKSLEGTRSVRAVNGIATFSNLSVKRSGSDFVLTARSPSLNAAASVPFTVGN